MGAFAQFAIKIGIVILVAVAPLLQIKGLNISGLIVLGTVYLYSYLAMDAVVTRGILLKKFFEVLTFNSYFRIFELKFISKFE